MANKELLNYAQEIIDTIPELTEAERNSILQFARSGSYDTIKELVIEFKTKYGYYGGKGGTF